MRSFEEKDAWKGVVAGALGGLAATWIMTQFQNAMSCVESRGDNQKQESEGGAESATVKAAQAISRAVTGHELPDRPKQTAGNAVHYAFGTLNGMFYGGLAEHLATVSAGNGLLFGAGVWAIADEVAVPAAGLAPPPMENPAKTHLEALGAHLVYGMATYYLTKAARRALDQV